MSNLDIGFFSAIIWSVKYIGKEFYMFSFEDLRWVMDNLSGFGDFSGLIKAILILIPLGVIIYNVLHLIGKETAGNKIGNIVGIVIAIIFLILCLLSSCAIGETGGEYPIEEGVESSEDETINLNEDTIMPEYKEILISTVKMEDSLCLSATYDGNYVRGVTWESENPTVAAVDDDGNVMAVSEGTTYITASAVGYTKASCRVKVYPDGVDSQTKTVRYLETIPDGIAQDHSDFITMSEMHDISPNKPDNEVYKAQGWEQLETSVIGYVYWHWCRGIRYDFTDDVDPYDDDGNPHNRRSFPENTIIDINNDGTNRDDFFTLFSCFFSDRYLSTDEMYFDRDTDVDDYYGRSVWYPDADVCHDSYWFWFVPVCESTYEKHTPKLAIRAVE